MTKQSAGPDSRVCSAIVLSSSAKMGEGNLSIRVAAARRRVSWGCGIVAFVAAVMACAVGAFAQAPTLAAGWNVLSPATSPSARWDGAMAYDSAHGQVVMFGGLGGTLNDTWLWNGTNWSQASPITNPTARANQAMAFDSAHGEVVMFGGIDSGSTRLGETWLWNGTNWSEASPLTSPSARDGAAMVYDAALGKVVLFGGLNAGGIAQGDTWLWDGTNWSQASPVTNPGARFDQAMAYDAAHSQVVMFGGFNGSYLNETWVWNGSNWIQHSPAHSPSGRYGEGMDYDAAQGQVVMFGGFNGSVYVNDTWTWNGTDWSELSAATGPSPRYATNTLIYDTQQEQLVLFGGYDGSNLFGDTWTWATPQNFGGINVCSAGAPTPCSNTLSLTYNVPVTTIFGTPKVVTQGSSTLDYQPGAGNTCTGSVSAGGSCTVNVTFTPQAPGLRLGAVELVDDVGGLLATTPIYGTGQASEAAFGPATTYISQSQITYSNQVSAVPNLNYSNGMTFDAAGTVYQAVGANVLKAVPGNNPTIVASGFGSLENVAIDGAGNLYVADTSLGGFGEVAKLAPGCASASCASVLYTSSSLPGPFGVAVDGLGDVFFSKPTLGVFELPAGGGAQTQVYGPGGGSGVYGLAVDAAGDLFVTDNGLHQVVKIPAGCTSAACRTLIGSGWVGPQSVAVDAAGDVIVADPTLTIAGQADAGGVVEVPAGCTTPSCQILLWTGGAPDPFQVAVNAAGQIFIATDGTPVVEVNQPQAPSLSFATTNVGSQSPMQTFTVQDIGNQALSSEGPSGVVVAGPNFVPYTLIGPTLSCTAGASFVLQPGQSCDVGVDFEPQASGPLTSTAVITDNSLNGALATQTVNLSGTGTGALPSYTLKVTDVGSGSGSATDNLTAITCTLTNGSSAGTGPCSASYQGGTLVTLTANVSAGSKFLGWGGACAGSGTSTQCLVTMNSSMNVTANFAQGIFGNVNVCPGGSSSGCTASNLAVTFNIAAGTTVSSIQVVTQGIAGLDFTLGNGSTCTGSFPSVATCNVNVNFTLLAPGLRSGAVNLIDSGGNVLATQFVSGVGQGSAVAFDPGTQTTLPTSGITGVSGVAVDAAGNVFISNNAGAIKLTPSGVQSTVPASGISAAYDVAVDGAGDVFLADTGNNRVVEVTPSGVQTTVPATGLLNPTGVAVDGAGDVFITDRDNNRVVEVTPSGVQTTVPTTGVIRPYYPAVDAAGDVFFLDSGNELVLKITPGGIQSSVPISGLASGNGVAVDAAGDVFVSDQIANVILEVTPSGVQTTVPTNGLYIPAGLAVDGAGDVFIAGNGQTLAYEVNRSAPVVNFGVISESYQTSDAPLSVQNIGNQTLNGSLGPVSGAYFFEDAAGSTCATILLAPGASCVENFYSYPQAVGSISGTAVVTDDALSGNSATQTIVLSALSLGSPVGVNVTIGGTGTGFVESDPAGIDCGTGGSPGTCLGQFSAGLTISLEESSTGGSTFAGWGGACASAGASQFCAVTITGTTSITANFTSAITYPLTVTGVGTGVGVVTSSPAGIACTETAGIGSGTCSAGYGSGTGVTLTANAAAGSAFLGWGGACSGLSPTCNVTMVGPLNVSASFAKQNFGNVNVCPQGQNSPAPCTGTIILTYNIPVTTTFGATQVLTQGVAGLDFSLGGGGTCTGTILGGTSCHVNVTFTPLAPGLRTGAVSLFDNTGAVIATTPVYGTAVAPAIAFGPGTQTPVFTGSSPYQLSGVVVDAAGDLFVAENQGTALNNGLVVKVAANGTQSPVGSGLAYPQGLALDGAGDLFIADNNLNAIVEVTPAGVQTAMNFGLTAQLGVAVDGAGDLFIGDFNANLVAEAPAGCTSSACTTTVYNAGAGLHPVGLATDAAGDLFVADFSDSPTVTPGKVVEIPVGCTSASCQIAIGTGWYEPEAVGVDAAGDVFVADELPQVVEVPVGCNSSTCQIMVSNVLAYGVAVDAKGDVILPDRDANPAVDPDSNQVVVFSGSQPPALSFALTNVGSTSGPQSVSIQNVGNAELTGSIGLSLLGPNFTQNGSSNCGSTLSLAPGASCSESFNFAPLSTGAFTGVVDLNDNTLNLSSLVGLQTVNLSGTGGLNGQPVGTVVPNVVGMSQTAATSAIANAGLTLGAVSSDYSSSEPAGTVMGESPAAGSSASPGAAVAVRLSIGEAPAKPSNPLSFENNYFVTGDYATAGVTLHGAQVVNSMVTGTISIPASSGPGSQGVPTGADIVDGYLYWEALENTAAPSASTGTFLGYQITGQQVGSDLPFTDGTLIGTLRVYRADVNNYFQDGASGIRVGSGSFAIALPAPGTSGYPLAEGASLVVIYRVLSPNFPLKSVVIYDGSATSSATQTIQGFYDAAGGAGSPAEVTTLSYAGGTWNGNPGSVPLNAHASSYTETLNSGNAYAAVILSTPVTNSDNDGILDAWKAGPQAGDFFVGQAGYYDVKTSSWVSLAGAVHGQKDLFVQLDYMCGTVNSDGSCGVGENLFPSPDPDGNDPLAMVQQAFAKTGIHLHLEVGNAVAETTCTDSPGQQLCQFPGEPGVIGWKNSLEFSKLWPRNFDSCAAGGDCTARFPYGQKDSYHYVLFGHSLAIPAWNSRYGTITSISVNGINGQTTIVTPDRGTGINACPNRFTISGVQGNPSLNGVYNTSTCPDTSTIILATPGLTTSWSYPNNTLPEPVIGLTSGTVTSISGYSDLGGADSAVTLGLWETAPNQDMSKRANVVAGTLFHEIGHTIGLSHGGLYYDTPGSYVPTFEANCKPNYQSIMNYLFQLDGVGPSSTVAFSNQTLTQLSNGSFGGINQLLDTDSGMVGAAATFPTSAWYVPYTSGTTTASPATLHCDGTPLGSDAPYYRVDGPIAPITPAWTSNQNITYDGVPYSMLRGFNDVANIDLRQVGATGGEFASLSNVLSFGSSETPVKIAAGGNVTLGAGGNIALGAGGNVTLGAGGNVTLGGAGTVAFPGGGNVTLNNGGSVGVPSQAVISFAKGGNVTLDTGGNVTLGGGGNITLGAGGNVTLGGGGNVTLGGGGTIALVGGGSVTIPSTGGSYTIPPTGGTVTLNGAGNVTLGGGGNVTLGAGGNIALGAGGNVTLGAGGNVTLGAGGNIALGASGNVTLGAGGNVTLGAGGNVTLGAGGNVTLGAGGNVTLGAGGNVTLGAGGNVTLGAGGNVTLGAGGNVTLGAGGNVTLGAGGTVTLSSGGTIISGATMQTVPAGTYTVSAGGNITLGGGGTITLAAGGNVTLGAGGNVTLGAGGNVTLGGGGNVTLGGGGNITLGGGGITTNELTYDTANSIVRPPPSATYTQQPISGITVNWTAPAFGVVQTYTIYRSVDGGTPVAIGSVSGVNGNPPATTFTDANPPTGTLVYTITTTLIPDTGTSTERESLPSPPAVLTLDQTIALGSLPSSVSISSASLTVTATAESNGVANGQLVNLSATGQCSAGSSSITGGVTSAVVTLNNTGSCIITASQAGFTTSQSGGTSYNAADSVTGSFTIVPQSSNLTSQTINFATLLNVHYGGTFTLNATSSSGQPVSFTASGPCSTNGKVNGVGVCSITASAPATDTYSAASTTQTFNVIPAVLTVAAGNLTTPYGQIPSLTSDYTITGFVNSDPSSVVTGAPALSTTATSTSAPGPYPITVLTGSLAAANYDFFFVNGTLTIQQVNQTALVLSAASPLAYHQSELLSLSGGSTGGAVTYNIGGSCTVSGGQITANSGAGSCTVSATMAGNSGYNPVTSNTVTITLQPASQAALVLTAASPLTYNLSEALGLTGGSTGGQVTYSVTTASGGSCTISGTQLTAKSGTGACTVSATMAGNSNYSQATSNSVTVTLQAASQTITFTQPGSPVTYGVTPITLVATVGGSGNAVVFTIDHASTATGSIAGNILTVTGVGNLVIDANEAGNSNYTTATQVQRTIVVNQATATISVNDLPAAPVFGGSFTPAYTYSGVGTPTESTNSTTSGVCAVTSGTVHFVGVGTCTLTASATATTDDLAATGNPQSFIVGKATQTITFTQPNSPITYGVSPIGLSASAAPSLAVTFSIDASSTGGGTISGSMLTIKKAGTLVIDANQAGNADYTAAAQVQRAIVISKAVLTVTANNASRAYGLANPTFTASYGPFVNGDSFATAVTGSPSLTTTAVATSLPGSYPITASQGTLAAANYSFIFVNGTLTVSFSGAAPPSGTACNGAYSGTFTGNLTVTNGQNCIFVGGGASGNITETGGNLVLNGATVGGNITISTGTFTIGPSTTIKGNLDIQSIPKGSATNQVCGTTINSSLVFQANGTAVVIGSGSPSCASNTIKGSVQVQSNSAAATVDGNNITGSLQVQSNSGATILDGNTIGGALQDQSNAGATQVFTNAIKGALQCQSNTTITGSGNTAASKTGQCAKF